MVQFVKERKPIVLWMIGQSNEKGQVPLTDTAAPQAFASLQNPALTTPIGPSLSVLGGSLFKIYDDLLDYGYETKIVNGAIGSMSLVRHAAGQVLSRSDSTGYRARRDPKYFGDRGYIGDVVSPAGTKMIRCIAGNSLFAFQSAPQKAASDQLNILDTVVTSGSAVTAASGASAFNTWHNGAAVGDTFVDGGITWQCESLTSYAAANASFTGSQGGLGWDPLGILQHGHEEVQRISGAYKKIAYICNGQSDNWGNQSWYQAALTNIVQWLLDRGYFVMIGLSVYTPTQTTANWDFNQAARAAVLASYASNPNVAPGANLYNLMGTNPVLQADNVHLTGPSAIVAGGYHADAIKAVLTDRRPLTGYM